MMGLLSQLAGYSSCWKAVLVVGCFVGGPAWNMERRHRKGVFLMELEMDGRTLLTRLLSDQLSYTL